MIIFKDSDGQFYTETALKAKIVSEAQSGWDEAVQGPFEENFDSNDWLIEAKLVGLVTELEVNE